MLRISMGYPVYFMLGHVKGKPLISVLGVLATGVVFLSSHDY